MNLSELKSLVEIEKKKARLLLCEAPQPGSRAADGSGARVRSDYQWDGNREKGGPLVAAEIVDGGVLNAYNPPTHVFPDDPQTGRRVVVLKVYYENGLVEHVAFYSSSGQSYDKYIKKVDKNGQLVKVLNPKYVPPGKWIPFGGIVYRGNHISNHRRGINSPGYWLIKMPSASGRKDVNVYSDLANWLDKIDRNGAFHVHGQGSIRIRTDQLNKTLHWWGALKRQWRAGDEKLGLRGVPMSVVPGVEVTKDYYYVVGQPGRPPLDPQNIPGSLEAPSKEKLSPEARRAGYDSNPAYDDPNYYEDMKRLDNRQRAQFRDQSPGQGSRRQNLRYNLQAAVNKIKNRRGYVVLPRTLTKGWKPVSKKSGADATIIGQRLQEMAPEMPGTSTKRILDFWGTKAGTVGAVIDLGFFASEIHEIIDNKSLSQNQKEAMIRNKAKKHAIDASKDTAICFVLAKTLTPAACAAYLFGPLVYYAGAAALTVAKDALVGLGDFLSDVINIGPGTITPQEKAKFEREDQVIDGDSYQEEEYYDCMNRQQNGEKVYWNPKAHPSPQTRGKWHGECIDDSGPTDD